MKVSWSRNPTLPRWRSSPQLVKFKTAKPRSKTMTWHPRLTCGFIWNNYWSLFSYVALWQPREGKSHCLPKLFKIAIFSCKPPEHRKMRYMQPIWCSFSKFWAEYNIWTQFVFIYSSPTQCVLWVCSLSAFSERSESVVCKFRTSATLLAWLIAVCMLVQVRRLDIVAAGAMCKSGDCTRWCSCRLQQCALGGGAWYNWPPGCPQAISHVRPGQQQPGFQFRPPGCTWLHLATSAHPLPPRSPHSTTEHLCDT